MQRRFGLLLVAALSVVAACSDDDDQPTECPEHYRVEGPACVPQYGECDSGQVPLLGGACQAVGITTCASGFEPDSADGCAPVLPEAPCGPGTMARVGDATCVAVGVRSCGQGFDGDGEGGCAPVLPPVDCANDELPVLGSPLCAPLAECGTGPWGNLTGDASPLYVDASFIGTPDGSAAAPYPTVGEAVAVASPGRAIYIAAGDYPEHLALPQRVFLKGRCPALVTLRGVEVAGTPRAPVEIPASATGAALSGVTLTGDGPGLEINGATGVVVERVRVQETGAAGVLVRDGEATLRRVLVHRATARGVHAVGSEVTLNRCVVQDTRPLSGAYGRGVQAECNVQRQVCGRLEVQWSVLQRNHDSGILLFGTDARIAGSVVRDTQPRPSDGLSGRGINAQCDYEIDHCGWLEVRQVVLTANHDGGVVTQGYDTQLQDTTIRGGLAAPATGTEGRGINSQCDSLTGLCGQLTVAHCRIAETRTAAVTVIGERAVIRGSVLEATAPRTGDQRAGRGLDVACDTQADHCDPVLVEDTLIANNHAHGVLSTGTELTLRGVQVRNTRSRASDGGAGIGVAGQCDAAPEPCHRLTITGSLIERSREMGLLALGREVLLSGSVVRHTLGREGDLRAGFGAMSAAAVETGREAQLEVVGSLVAGNRAMGVVGFGGDLAIRDTVIRDTEARLSDGFGGRGVEVQCRTDLEVCGVASVAHSLVVSNRDAGMFVSGAELRVTDSVIRNQLPAVAGSGGSGVVAGCDLDVGRCAALLVERCLVASNLTSGIRGEGDLTITDSLVRDTGPQPDGAPGHGIHAACDPAAPCGRLDVQRTVVARNHGAGVSAVGVATTLTGLWIHDTHAATSADGSDFGHGVMATCPAWAVPCGTLTVSLSHIASSVTAGIATEGVPGSVSTSLVEGVQSRPADAAFGYGLQLARGDVAAVTFLVDRCVVRDAELAGVFFAGVEGILAGSNITQTPFPVVLDAAADAQLSGGNRLEGTITNEPTVAEVEPSASPDPLGPMGAIDIDAPTQQ